MLGAAVLDGHRQVHNKIGDPTPDERKFYGQTSNAEDIRKGRIFEGLGLYVSIQ